MEFEDTVHYVVWLVAGAVLGGLFTRLVTGVGRPTTERWLFATGLAVAAAVYVAFALFGGADQWLRFEVAGGVAFTALAVAGALVSPLYLAAGWLLHAAWDSPLHLASSGSAFVPKGYILLCLAFDIVVGGAILVRDWRGAYRDADGDTNRDTGRGINAARDSAPPSNPTERR